MKSWKFGLLAGGSVAACAACCAAPLLVGSALAGLGTAGVGFAEWGEKGLIAALLALGAAWLFGRWLLSARRTQNAGCDCGPSSGCRRGDSCDAPTPLGSALAK
jgi:hypothetical protein